MKNNPYQSPNSRIANNENNKDGSIWRGVIVVSYAVISILAILAIFVSGSLGGAVGRELLSAIFVIPSVFGRGGKLVKFLAYVYCLDMATSILQYAYMMYKYDFISLSYLQMGYIVFKSLIGASTFVYLWRMKPTKRLSLKERIEPALYLDES